MNSQDLFSWVFFSITDIGEAVRYLGIMFGIGLLQLFEMGSMEDGIVTIHYQVNFWIAILATAILCILGGLTGLAPAWRAMKIKPVDAMRDE